VNWKEFLRPKIGKILLSFLITLAWIGIQFLIILIQNPGVSIRISQVSGGISFSFTKPGLAMINAVSITLFGVLWGTLWSYPFASSLYHLWPQYKKGKLLSAIKEKKILLGILIFNPSSLTIIGNILTFSLIYFSLSISPDIECGVYILNVFPNSPAERVGLQAGSSISAINGEIIETVSEFSNIIKNTKPGDKITVSYLKDSTFFSGLEITLGENPSED